MKEKEYIIFIIK